MGRVAELGSLDEIVQPSAKIPLSRFPADLATVLALPAAGICLLVASSLPHLWRMALFALLGVVFITLGIRLTRFGHLLPCLYGVLYIVMGISALYIAFLEATFFA